jgi:hypothetical protein
VPGWTLEQLLEAQMSSSEHWNDATSGVAAAVSAPARRKLPAVEPALEPGPRRPAQ